MGIQLKEGGVYARADGTERKVQRRDEYVHYPWIDAVGTIYTANGRIMNNREHLWGHPNDLIRVVSEPDESVPTRDFLAEIAQLEADRDGWKRACRKNVTLRNLALEGVAGLESKLGAMEMTFQTTLELYKSALKEAAGWRKICEGHALRLEALGEKS
jgi:hypothetical protein